MAEEVEKQSTFFQYQYETSAVFASMKKVEERITKNWSTEQYLNALDTLISHAIEPIIRSSNFMDHIVAGLLAWHSDTANNKITAHSKMEAVNYMMAFLTRRVPDEKLKIFNRIRFDRNITLVIIESWLKSTKGYRRACEKSIADPFTFNPLMIECEQAVLHGPSHSSLYAAIPTVVYWRDQAVTLRTQILEKYYRLILNEAKGFYELMEHSISLDDTIQAMCIEATHAVDKCNQERGTITSYMQRWLRFSRSSLDTEMDTAYVMPGHARNGDFTYKSASLNEADTLGSTSDEDSRDITLHVRKLARILDPLGVGRHSLGIDEFTPALIGPGGIGNIL